MATETLPLAPLPAQEPKPTTIVLQALRAAGEPRSPRQLAEATGRSQPSVLGCLNSLHGRGIVRPIGENRWEIGASDKIATRRDVKPSNVIPFPRRAEAAAAIEDPDPDHVELARFPRAHGSVLRVSLDTWLPDDAKAPVKTLQLRFWCQSSQGGGYYPSKLGISIRRDELAETIGALQKAARLLGVEVSA